MKAIVAEDLDKSTNKTMNSTKMSKSQPITLWIKAKIEKFKFLDPKTRKRVKGWDLDTESKAGPNAVGGSYSGSGCPCYTKEEAERRLDEIIKTKQESLSRQNAPRLVKVKVKLKVKGKEVPYPPPQPKLCLYASAQAKEVEELGAKMRVAHDRAYEIFTLFLPYPTRRKLMLLGGSRTEIFVKNTGTEALTQAELTDINKIVEDLHGTWIGDKLVAGPWSWHISIDALLQFNVDKDLDETMKAASLVDMSKSQPELTLEQLNDIARRLAIHICGLHFNYKRCKGCTERRLIEQLGLCDREDLDKQEEEMRKRKEKVSKSQRARGGGGVSVYFVPCYCHTCGHRCSNVYGPYFKVRNGASVNLSSVDIQMKVSQAAQAYRISHPGAVLPGDPGWTGHKHSHKEDK